MGSSLASAARRFRTTGGITLTLVYLLILAGSVVRTTGSGMGCPDWPRCFDQWVPPTHISQLPADYRTRFAVKGRTIAVFSAFKTWVEFINRLLGVLVGFAIFLTTIFALPYRRNQPRIFWASLLALLLVMGEGWLGARVVATHLAPGLITAHMLLALALVGVLCYAVLWPLLPVRQAVQQPAPLRWHRLALTVLTLIVVQVTLGTQVREQVDVLADSWGTATRMSWAHLLGTLLQAHGLWGGAVLLSLFLQAWLLYRSPYRTAGLLLLGLASLGVVAGSQLANKGFPAALQPTHLLLAMLLAGGQWVLVVALLKRIRAVPSVMMPEQLANAS